MSMHRVSPVCPRLSIGLLFAFLVVGSFGCTPEETEQAVEEETSGLRMLSPVMGGFIAAHQGRYPQSEDELRKFLEGQGRNPDELLVSKRDGKPVVIVTQAERAKVKGNIVAYEREGKDGTRLVVDDIGVISEVTEEEFNKLVPQG